MNIMTLATLSLWSRRTPVLLTMASISLSVALVLSVQRLRIAAQQSFEQTISGTDLIVGARTSPLQLLMSAVFRSSTSLNAMSAQSFAAMQQRPEIAWAVPMALGDSHRGFSVLGTNPDYFQYYRYGAQKPLVLSAGAIFSDAKGAVLGSEVAERLKYTVGTELILAHGLGEASFEEHSAHPMKVVGILAPTGTPVDRTVHVSLEALAEMHVDADEEHSDHADEHGHEHDGQHGLALTAVLLGLHERSAALSVQRQINEYPKEPLTAILPGVAFRELWNSVGVAETALVAISIGVLISGFLGMLAAILMSLGERRREMAILRTLGARPRSIFFLLLSEAMVLATGGALLGSLCSYGLIIAGRGQAERYLGMSLALAPPTLAEWAIIFMVMGLGAIAGILPAFKAYRQALADGLVIRS